jgi:hypothetical protein
VKRRTVNPTRKLLLTIHIACATTSLGASAVGLAVLTGQPASSSPADLPGSGRLLLGCLTAQALAVGSGLLVALCSRWGLFRYGWVVKKLCLTLAGLLVQAGLDVLGHRPGTRLWQLEIGLGAVLVLSVLATVLSVYKPGGRIGSAGRRDRPVAIRADVRIREGIR